MKRTILAVLLLICAGFSVFGQNTDPADIILLLNTSTGMSSSYENVNEYITGNFLSEFLRVGDTFHLVAFSGTPRLDVARRISARGDVETIIGRMLLQYPIESGNNVGEAIRFAEQYVQTLPSRPKKIVLVSIGGSEVNDLVSSARQRLGSNTTIDFVEVTPGQRITSTPSSGRAGSTGTSSGTGTGSSAAGTGSSAGTASTGTGTQQGTSSSTATQQGTTTQGTGSSVEGTASTGSTSTQGSADSTASSSSSSASSETGTSSTGTSSAAQTETTRSDDSTSRSDTSGTQQTRQQTTTTSPARTTERQGFALSAPVIIGIVLLLLLILGLIIFFASRSAGSTPSRAIAGASSYDPKEDARFPDHSKDLAKYAAAQSARRSTPYSDKPYKANNVQPVVINPSGPLLLNIFVEDQNTAIGKRNIHSLKSGYSLTVGGGNSDFLIFLVKIPPAIGELRRNGSQLSFIPRKPKYFPDLGSSEVRDCLNKTIRVVSDKGYELRFRFEMYEDPLVTLNRVLLSIKVPG